MPSGDGTGIEVGSECILAIEGNVISEFEYGIRSVLTSGASPSEILISGNSVSNNSNCGVYLASNNIGVVDGPDATINQNDILENSAYGLYLGAYRNPDTRTIDATSNWWGTSDPLVIPTLVYDHADDPLSPTALFEPILSEPVTSPESNIWVTPAEFHVELFPDSQATRELWIGNRGTLPLSFEILEAASAPEKSERTDIPWLSENPTAGVINPSGSLASSVLFSSHSLEDDVYEAFLVIQSDDPVNDLVVVPAQMVVSHVFLFGPANGDSLALGDVVTLGWTTYQAEEIISLDLFYSTDEGQSFPHEIAIGLPNSPPYEWTVSGAVGVSCQLMIVAHYVGGASYSFVPEAIFTIYDPFTGIPEDEKLPRYVRLHQNYPNPFNPATTIVFELPGPEEIAIDIFDVSGRLVRTLTSGTRCDAGRHEITWDGTDERGRGNASGVYFCRMKAGFVIQTVRLTLVK